MEKPKRSRILQMIVEREGLPSPSPLVIQLLRMASGDEASMKDLARVIEKDPALTTRLLKLANTVFYTRRKKVSTVSEAVLVMGFNKLRVMALTISFRDSFPLGKANGMDYEYFWSTSLYRAVVAQELIGREMLRAPVTTEEVFISALILEIGMLMLYHVCPEDLKNAFPGGNSSLEEILEWEERYLGINHREAGSVVLNRWHFPEHILLTQRYWGEKALGGGAPPTCKILEFARACTQVLYGKQADFALIEETSQRLGLDSAAVNELLSAAFFKVEDVAGELLRLNVDAEKDILEVVEKANRALAKINGSLDLNLGKILSLVSTYGEPDQCGESKTGHEDKNMAKDLLDAIAHEIRNPLMAIGGFARRLANTVEGRGELQKYSNIIIKESSRLERLLGEVITFSQGYQPDLEKCDVVELINESIDEMQKASEGVDVEMIRNFMNIRLLAFVDGEAFKKAIQQLLQIVIRYLDKAGELERPSVEMKLVKVKDHVEISISGNQLNIPEGLRKEFSSVDFSSKTLGYGFSLVVARKIVEAHMGRVELEGENGNDGFRVFLPVEEV